jgi:hypothetical protein
MREPPELRLSRPDLAAELVRDILTQKVESRQRERFEEQERVLRKKTRSLAMVFLVLTPLFLIITAVHLGGRGAEARVFTRAEEDAGVRLKIYLAAQAVRAYRDSTRRWPITLGEVGFEQEGLRYRRIDNTFEISDTNSVIPFTYRGDEDPDFFRSAYKDLMK